jgi:lipoate-protein ligase A
LIKISGQIARKLKFLGHLGVKLKKLTANDVSVKGTKIKGLN